MPKTAPCFPDPQGPHAYHIQLPCSSAALQDYNIQLFRLEAENLKRLARARREMALKHSKPIPNEDLAAEQPRLVMDPRQDVSAKITSTHSMCLVSRKLGAEYRQLYYERTRFFLRIHLGNVLHGIPHLIHGTSASEAFPDFWGAPKILFEYLRECTVYVELGDIEEALHRQGIVGFLAEGVCEEIVRAVKMLIGVMCRLRSVHVVFAHRRTRLLVEDYVVRDVPQVHEGPCPRGETRVRKIVTAVRSLVEPLQEISSLRDLRVVVGDVREDHEEQWKVMGNGRWVVY